MGDSYASGLGSGLQPKDDTNRCFRFPNAYPVLTQAGIQPNPAKFNQVACSGNTFQQILENQLLDKEKDDGKNGIRPVWGTNPEFVTMTMGGNDIGILNLVSTCIMSFKLWGMDCDAVIQNAHDIIASQKFKDDLDSVIQATVDKGRGKVGDKFKVFITGYARFFNQTTTQCDTVSFKPWWVPLKSQYLTIERRTKMNDLTLVLNNALRTAAEGFKDQGVIFVDYDGNFDTHRFCDRDEPNPDDEDTWFFSWYTKKDPKSEAQRQLFEKVEAFRASSEERTEERTEELFKTDDDFINALYDAAGDGMEAQSILSDSERIFHPKERGHEAIRDNLMAVLAGAGIPGESAPYAEGRCCFYAVQRHDANKKFGEFGEPYSVELTLLDNDKKEIKSVPETDCGDKNRLVITSKLEDALVVVPEEHNDYIQF